MADIILAQLDISSFVLMIEKYRAILSIQCYLPTLVRNLIKSFFDCDQNKIS